MADDQPEPEVVATADLALEAPQPINLSSPLTVPTLQDQVDTTYDMSLPSATNPSGVNFMPETSPVKENGDIKTIESATVEALQLDNGPDAGITSDEMQGSVQTSNEVKVSTPAMENDEDDYARNFDSPAAVEDGHQDIPKVSESTIHDNAPPHQVTDQSKLEHDALRGYAFSSAEEPISTSPPHPDSHQLPSADQPTNPHPDVTRAAATLSTQDETIDPALSESAESSADNSASAEEAIDIQALVDNITAKAAASEPPQTMETTMDDGPSHTAPHPIATSSLPPRPPISQQPSAADLRAEELRISQSGATHPNHSALANVPPGVVYPYSGPGPIPNAPPSFAPSAQPVYTNPSVAAASTASQFSPAHIPPNAGLSFSSPQTYDDFIQEERKYVSEAKWDRFPSGSRLFIGNLSSERVQKKEVFDLFGRFGRLAQISLKQAYGFVQYHTNIEGQAAMDNLQGVEVQGRKIHLEFSHPQKKDNDGDKRGGRGERGPRSGRNQPERDRFEGRRRDDYRPRSPSPSRGSYRPGSHGRDRGSWESAYDRTRGRSRSPVGYGGSGYRRRSPSPYRRGAPQSEADLDIPRRHGSAVPDVQLLLLQEVNRDFVTWVQGAFTERGLQVDIMFLNPRFPRDLVIQRQVVEGVHAVAELDFRAQSIAKIPLQVFDRSAGTHNARFDQYQDLDPKIAAELVSVARAKARPPMAPSGGYGTGPYPPYSYPQYSQPPVQPNYPSQTPSNPSLAGLQHLDNATLQKVLSAIQGGPQSGAQASMGIAPGVDVNAVLHALGANGPAAAPVAHHQGQYGPPGGPPSSAANESHVQNIMAQLSRYR